MGLGVVPGFGNGRRSGYATPRPTWAAAFFILPLTALGRPYAAFILFFW